MSQSQVEDACIMILSEFKQLTMTDITLIFRNAKTGVYGKFYERIGLQDVMTWFRDYFEDRQQISAQMSLKDHGQTKFVDNQGKGKSGYDDPEYIRYKNTKKFNEVYKNENDENS